MFKRCLVTLVLALFASMLVTACGQDSKTNVTVKNEKKVEAVKKAEDAAKKAEDAAKKAEDAAKKAENTAKKPTQGIPLPDNF